MFPRKSPRLSSLILLVTLLIVPFIPFAAWAQNETSMLSMGAPVEREIAGGARHDYQYQLQAGEFLHLRWREQKISLMMTIKGPDGLTILAIRHETHTQAPLNIGLVADKAGTYRISISPIAQSAQPGRYQLEVTEQREATEQDRIRFKAELTSAEGARLKSENTAQSRRDAILKYEEARVLWHQAGDLGAEAATLVTIGRINISLAQYQKALDVLNQALAISRPIGDKQGEADALGNIAAIYQQMGDTEKSLELNRQTLLITQALGDRSDEAIVMVNIGLIYDSDLSDTKNALEYYQKALKIFQELGDHWNEAVTLNNIGNAYKHAKGYQSALDYFARALPLRREIKDLQGEAATLNNIGSVHVLLGEYTLALDYFTQANTITRTVGYRRGEALTLISMAQSLDGLGKTVEAASKMEEALKIIDSMRADLVGEEDRAKFFATTESYYKFYVDLLMKLHEQNPSTNYSAAALEASERARARILLEQLNETRVNLRRDVNPDLLKQERQIQQQINSKTLAQWMLERGEHTPEQLAAAQKEIDELISRYQQLENAIRSSSPRYAALTRPQLLGVPEIQKQVLDSDTLLLEYMLGTDRSYLWLVSSHSILSFTLPPRALIEKTAQRYYDLLTARAQRVKFETPEEKSARIAKADAELAQVGVELSRILLGPAGAELGTKRLLVVGDGLLHLVPFAALPLPGNASRPLIVEHEIVNIPSASALAELRSEQQGRKVASKAIAVLADPVFEKQDERVKALMSGRLTGSVQKTDFKAESISAEASDDLTRSAMETGLLADGAGIPRLPYTRQEANAIAALTPVEQREEALDFDANRATATSARLGQYRFIHFATHGLLNNDHPELSGIILSLVDRQGREQDGFLRASEIFQLRLPVEMVVLSGCRTGLGRQTKGEGMIGLTQGFMYAGAARVVVSLWDVNDAATAELMARFYKSLLGQKPLSTAGALRAAQVSIWRDKRWQSPYYWSAFVLEGEPR